jgi:hypothetical protein
MLLAIGGAFLMALGLFSGAVLTLVPLGLVPWTSDLTLWVLFPLFCVMGYGLVVIGTRSANARGWTLGASAALLLLAALAAVGLVLRAAAIVHSELGSASLWYVLIVAGLLGLIGAASFSRPAP